MYLINTVHKQIGIEARRGHKGKYFTRCGFNRDQRAAPAGERAFSSLLQTAIQGESQTIPLSGRAILSDNSVQCLSFQSYDCLCNYWRSDADHTAPGHVRCARSQQLYAPDPALKYGRHSQLHAPQLPEADSVWTSACAPRRRESGNAALQSAPLRPQSDADESEGCGKILNIRAAF